MINTNKPIYWYLDDELIPVPTNDARVWGDWSKRDWNENGRRVARTEVSKDCYVSTVFLGIDHQFGEGPPILYETLVFGGPEDQLMFRYSTREEAEEGHANTVLDLKYDYYTRWWEVVWLWLKRSW